MLSRAAKSRQEIKSSLESKYGDKNMSESQINSLIKAVKDNKNDKSTAAFMAAIAASV
jgi:hypothetical protein